MIAISLTSRIFFKCALIILSISFASICELACKFETIFAKNEMLGEDLLQSFFVSIHCRVFYGKFH
jgi:hypothetical protein